MCNYGLILLIFLLELLPVGHIPPGSDERQVGAQPNGHSTFSEKNNLRYLQLVRKYSSIILGQFFGHLHSDSFRIIYNDNGKSFFFIDFTLILLPIDSIFFHLSIFFLLLLLYCVYVLVFLFIDIST